MDALTQSFLAAARAGKPVYIADVRNGYATLSDSESFPLELRLHTLGGGGKTFAMRFPRFIGYPEDAKGFVVDFFLASAYNVLSGVGGRALNLAVPPDATEEAGVLECIFRERFQIELPSHRRFGYGKCLNVAERMRAALNPVGAVDQRRFHMEVTNISPPFWAAFKPENTYGDAAETLRRLNDPAIGRSFLGIDVGGTDIKMVLSLYGSLTLCKEYDWNPAAFTTVAEFVEPIALLVRLVALAGVAQTSGKRDVYKILEPALAREADIALIAEIVRKAESAGARGMDFDGIGVSFPDVVVRNKIVGGETPKTQGMRDALAEKYDQAFAELSNFDKHLGRFVTRNGVVEIVNDGPMAAFTAWLEAAAKDPGSVRDGIFAHSLGTDLGTGWVMKDGSFPDIPLEIYSFIIDLGSWPERAYQSHDLRSIDNFNTRLSGTPQKLVSQYGAFRFALKFLPPEKLDEMRRAEYVAEREGPNGPELIVPTEPKDMRKPFLEYLMALAGQGSVPEAERIFEEIGRALAAIGREVDWVVSPTVRRRTLFGRLVKQKACFELMREGALAYDPAADLAVADDGMAETSLMRELAASPDYTVAQFAQAVGAAHYAKIRFLGKNSSPPRMRDYIRCSSLAISVGSFGGILLLMGLSKHFPDSGFLSGLTRFFFAVLGIGR